MCQEYWLVPVCTVCDSALANAQTDRYDPRPDSKPDARCDFAKEMNIHFARYCLYRTVVWVKLHVDMCEKCMSALEDDQ